MRLILASASPRRRELLSWLGVPFEVVEPRGIDEETASGPPTLRARTLAVWKAEHVLEAVLRSRQELDARWVVLGADTIVVAPQGGADRALGKPRGVEDARRMLERLSGRTHRVVTGVAVARPEAPIRVAAQETEVTFKPLTSEERERYLSTGDYAGKAGAYGIQGEGGALVSGFRGCYYNVVGLPIVLAAGLLDLGMPGGTCDCCRHPLQRAEGAERMCPALGP